MSPEDERRAREMQMKVEELQKECQERLAAVHPEMGRDRETSYGSFEPSADGEEAVLTGRHVTFRGIPQAQVLKEFSLDGLRVIDRLLADGYLATFRTESDGEGGSLRLADSNGIAVFELHDNARGVVELTTSDEVPTITIDFPDDARIEKGEQAFEVRLGERAGAVVVHKGWMRIADGNVLTLSGRATFLVDEAASNDERVKVARATHAKRVGAEVVWTRDGGYEAITIGDLTIKESRLDGEGRKKLSARIDAPDGRAKTVVFRFPEGTFACDRLSVRLWAVGADGAESPLDLRTADSLDDALEPADDGPEGFESYCTRSGGEELILVSIAHFSEKRLEVEPKPFAAPFGIPGLGALVVLAGLLIGGVARRNRGP